MNNIESNINEKNNEEKNEFCQFGNLTLYTDRVIELINKNIIDYSCKSFNLIINNYFSIK